MFKIKTPCAVRFKIERKSSEKYFENTYSIIIYFKLGINVKKLHWFPKNMKN